MVMPSLSLKMLQTSFLYTYNYEVFKKTIIQVLKLFCRFGRQNSQILGFRVLWTDWICSTWGIL